MNKLLRTVAVYQLSDEVLLSKSCFDKTFKVVIGGFEGEIITPKIEWKGERPWVVAPAMESKLERYVTHYTSSVEKGWGKARYWGNINKYHPKTQTIEEANLRTVLIGFYLDPEKISYSKYLHGLGHPEGEDIEKLFESVDSWFQSLKTWVSVAVDQDNGEYGPLESTRIEGNGLKIFTVDKEVSLPAMANNIVINLSSFEAVSLSLLRKIIPLINNAKTPSDSRLLLLDSKAAFRRGQFRRAVIEAGSALEIALVELNRNQTRVNIGSKPKTLGWYIAQPLISERAKLPENTKDVVVEVRNNAVHKNIIPSRKEANDLIMLVQKILNLIDPLPL